MWADLCNGISFSAPPLRRCAEVRKAPAIHELAALDFRPRKVFLFRAPRPGSPTLAPTKTAAASRFPGQRRIAGRCRAGAERCGRLCGSERIVWPDGLCAIAAAAGWALLHLESSGGAVERLGAWLSLQLAASSPATLSAFGGAARCLRAGQLSALGDALGDGWSVLRCPYRHTSRHVTSTSPRLWAGVLP